MKQLKDFTDKELEQVGNKWVHPKTNKIRYYLNPVQIINDHGFIFGLSNQEEKLFISPEFKWWVEDGEVKTTMLYTNHKRKYILPAVENNLYKMLTAEPEPEEPAE